jgi:hypothetical protein
MAISRDEALELLKGGEEGVNEWNRLRKAGEEIPSFVRANLSEADLSKANLGRADLGRASLSGANLSRANLSGADLSEADLSKANLGRADLGRASLGRASLSGANLSGANLSRANLSGANLSRADLSGANLSRVNLSLADLSGAPLWFTVFAGVDLSKVKGLVTCKHEGPSIVDHRTLEQSRDLPLSFLRGCGLPEWMIEGYQGYCSGPIQYYSCFISYSSKDDEFAQRLHSDLQGKGVRCWFAPEDLKIGDRVRNTIEEAIRLRDKLLVIFSDASVNQSDWVEHEVDQALDEEKRRGEPVLFPIRVDDAVMKAKFGWAKRIREADKDGRHIGDFTQWKEHDSYQVAFERLLRDLKQGGS